MAERRYPIGEVARQINRAQHTIRVWERTDRLPKHLVSHRDERGRRYWHKSQIEEIKAWMIEADMNPGKAFRRNS